MKKLLFVSLVIILASTIFFSSCGKAAPTAPKEVLIGYPASLTGMYAAFGEGGVFGAEQAVTDINAQGGIYLKQYGTKLPVRLIVLNTESDGLKAGTLAEDMILSSKVNFLMTGDEPPPMHANVSNIADRYKIPNVISTGPFEPWMGMRMETDTKWEYTWASGAFAIVEGAPEGDFRHKPGYTIMDTWSSLLGLFGGQTNKKAAVFASDDPDGVGWYGLFPKSLEDLGYNVVGEEKKLGLLPMDTTDFTAVINEWKNNNCEILWGNAPAPFFGTLWRQCQALDFKPKMVCVGRAPLFNEDVTSWGGDLPWGIGVEIWWHNSLQNCTGISDTTPQSLFERWQGTSGKPLNPAIGVGYKVAQVLFDAVERAGTLDGTAVNQALADTDLMTIGHRVKFDANHFSRGPLAFGQWYKTDTAQKWELKVVFSEHDFWPATAEPIFPVPYK